MEKIRMISPLENVYDIPVERNTLYQESFQQEKIEPHPMFGPYQLIGDSLFMRFSEKILKQPSKVVNGARSVGYCVSGQRIDQLRKRIQENILPLADHIMVLIGTNDVLCGGESEVMIKHFKRLFRLLRKKSVKKLVIITLPPIPKLCICFQHWGVIRKYNEFLMSLRNENILMDIEVLDVLPIFTKFKPALEFEIKETHLSLQRLNISERNSSLERSNSTERRNSITGGNSIWPRDNTLGGYINLKRTSSTERQDIVKREISRPETPESLVTSWRRKRLINFKPVETVPKQNFEPKSQTNIRNENPSPLFGYCQDMDEKKIFGLSVQGQSLKNKLAHYFPYSDHENENDASSSEESEKIQNFEKFHRTQQIMETPAFSKGTKRLLDIHDDDGNDIVAFNNAFNRGKKRKVEFVPPESQNPKLKRGRTSETKIHQKAIFSETFHGVRSYSPEKEVNENVTNDSWNIESDEENSDNCIYYSQEEADTDYNNEANEAVYSDFKHPFLDYITLTNETKDKSFKDQFSEYINLTNQQDFPKASSPIANEQLYFFPEDELKNDTISFVESEMRYDFSEGEIEDDFSDNSSADDSEKGEAETTESESEATTDDGGPKRQITPFVDSEFLDFLNSDPRYSSRYNNVTNMAYLNKSCAPVSSYISPRGNFLSARTTSDMDNILYGGSLVGPHLYSMPPPPPPPPPPPLPTYQISEFPASSYDDLLPRDKLIMEQSERICEISCYEKFYTVGTKRMDMIHLNHTGLARLQYFIEDSENVFL